MVLKVFSLIIIISLTFAGENHLDDLAYQLVLEKINKKVVPTSYIDEIFNNPSMRLLPGLSGISKRSSLITLTKP